MKKMLSFDDILIQPKFSTIFSRKDVSTTTEFLGRTLTNPVCSSNMDTVTESDMAKAMHNNGATSCLHRFCSIEDSVKMFVQSEVNPMVSIGIGKKELERAEALYSVGSNLIILDVAHGASMIVVQQVQELRKLLHHSARIIVGNFANKKSIEDFIYHLGFKPDALKLSVGGGSMCTTRVVTGCGAPTLGTILDCQGLDIPLIADGGIRNSGDYAKSLAAGADLVMCGSLFAGTDETPGYLYSGITGARLIGYSQDFMYDDVRKKYRGSASLESYEAQGKIADHRTPEGESTLIPHKGPVKNVLQQLEAGLRSSMSYVGASTIEEFRAKAEFIQITNGGLVEGTSHGKK